MGIFLSKKPKLLDLQFPERTNTLEKKKINLFQDKEYEELNWLNRAVEPFIFPLNDVIAQIPDRVDFVYEDVVEFVNKHHSMAFDKEFLFHQVAVRNGIAYQDTDKRTICDFLEVEIPGPITDVQVDFEKGEMSGTFSLVKKKPQLDDEDIKQFMVNAVNVMLYGIETDNFARLNDIMDLINCSERRGSRSVRYKRDAIMATMRTIFSEDKWRIRNVDLAIKCGLWITAYVNDGNLAALSNFTRLKCMTHKGNAIYSMEETV